VPQDHQSKMAAVLDSSPAPHARLWVVQVREQEHVREQRCPGYSPLQAHHRHVLAALIHPQQWLPRVCDCWACHRGSSGGSSLWPCVPSAQVATHDASRRARHLPHRPRPPPQWRLQHPWSATTHHHGCDCAVSRASPSALRAWWTPARCGYKKRDEATCSHAAVCVKGQKSDVFAKVFWVERSCSARNSETNA